MSKVIFLVKKSDILGKKILSKHTMNLEWVNFSNNPFSAFSSIGIAHFKRAGLVTRPINLRMLQIEL